MADKQSREENQCIHCGNQYREENSKPSFIKVCNECKQYRVSGGASFIRSKILEREIDYCRPLTPKQVDTVTELYKEYERTKPFSEVGKLLEESGDKMGASLLRLSVDVSNALKGLKAIQREAREATKALRELEKQQSKYTTSPHGVTKSKQGFSESFDKVKEQLRDKCFRCGGDEFIKTELRSYDEEKAIETNIECTKCGWKHNV